MVRGKKIITAHFNADMNQNSFSRTLAFASLKDSRSPRSSNMPHTKFSYQPAIPAQAGLRLGGRQRHKIGSYQDVCGLINWAGIRHYSVPGQLVSKVSCFHIMHLVANEDSCQAIFTQIPL